MKKSPVKLIKTSLELAQYCANLQAASYICIDSEFIREHQYWPYFCLAQIAPPRDFLEKADQQAPENHWLYAPAIIDPLAENIDLSPFYALLSNAKIIKVFHAARQDIELFWHITGAIPYPLFDTQLAASVCGFGDQISYDGLVSQLLGVTIDKSARLTDWSKRPLSEKSIHYALGDVLYLGEIYHQIYDRLKQTGRLSWLDEELAILGDASTYIKEPEMAYKRIKRIGNNLKVNHLIKYLAATRERLAQARDIPRGRILKDDGLLDIAAHAPMTLDALKTARFVPHGFAKSPFGQAMVDAIREGMAIPQTQWKKIEPSFKPAIEDQALIELLKLLLKLIALESGVSARLIATSDELTQFASTPSANPPPNIPFLKGWRYELFGEKAIKLKQGNLLFGLDEKKKIKFTFTAS